jgi:hypothetical protein
MIPCPTCSRTHRDEEAIEKCKVRAERRAEREAAKKADVERRLKNRKALPEEKFIQRSVREGLFWDRIVSGLNKDYPVREQGKWTLWDVVEQDSKSLNWSGFDLEQTTLLRLEKHMTGAFISAHPLSYVRWPEGVEAVDRLMARVRAQEERERGLEDEVA